MKLIDKAAIVAEIERRIQECDNLANAAADNNLSNTLQANELLIRQYKSLLYFLDTLETKEVDLEKEIDKWWCSQFTDYSMKRVPNYKFIPAPAYIDSNFKQSETGKTKIAFELWMDWKVDSNDIEWDSETIREFAKHFFELGMAVGNKAQKGG